MNYITTPKCGLKLKPHKCGTECAIRQAWIQDNFPNLYSFPISWRIYIYFWQVWDYYKVDIKQFAQGHGYLVMFAVVWALVLVLKFEIIKRAEYAFVCQSRHQNKYLRNAKQNCENFGCKPFLHYVATWLTPFVLDISYYYTNIHNATIE